MQSDIFRLVETTRGSEIYATDAQSDRVLIDPIAWAERLSDAPVLDCRIEGLVPALVRRWQGISPEIDQAALDRHFISVHLGGPKRLFRRGEGRAATRDTCDGDFSVVPAGAAFQWDTEGPVDFMHIYFDCQTIDRILARAFDRDPSHICLQESLGGSDALISSLAKALIEELDQADRQQAYLDDLMHLIVCRVLRLHSNASHTQARSRYVLAPFRLRRALDFIEANVATPIGVREIAAASGISEFHFSRAFHKTVGRSPYAYLIDRRIAAAKTLLIDGDEELRVIAGRCGFASPAQFSRMFKREAGLSPTDYRNRR